MKKFVALLSALSLASCANGTNIAPDVTAFENGVIADVEAACAVEPTLASIADLFPIYGADIAGAANAICAAVNNLPPAATAALAVGPGSMTGRPVRHGLPPVIVHGKTIKFQ